MTKKNNYAGGLSNYIVLKEEKEVIFYLHNPYPDCLEIPAIMKAHKPEDVKLLMEGPRGFLDAMKLGSLHEEYKQLKKRQSNE